VPAVAGALDAVDGGTRPAVWAELEHPESTITATSPATIGRLPDGLRDLQPPCTGAHATSSPEPVLQLGTFWGVSSANRQRRQQNRQNRVAAVEEAQRRVRRQRLMLATIGVVLAVAVAVVLVARAKSGNSSASSTTTTTAADTTTTVPPSSTTVPSAAGKPCVAMTGALPPGAPAVPVAVGPPPTKLVTEDLKVGTGAVVKPGATVTVNYIGVACSTGKVFDSSYSRNQPFTTSLADVVPGWTQGIPGMKVGGQRLLGIPPALAYGSQSPGAGIAPDETLWFVVDVLNTK
jgi:peptidylprolyl isomerase